MRTPQRSKSHFATLTVTQRCPSRSCERDPSYHVRESLEPMRAVKRKAVNWSVFSRLADCCVKLPRQTRVSGEKAVSSTLGEGVNLIARDCEQVTISE